MDLASLIENGFQELCRARYEQARQALEAAVALDDRSFEANLYLGRTLSYHGGADEARQFLRKAAGLDPEASSPWFYLAELSFAQEQFEDSLELARHGVELKAEDRPCQLLVGRCLARLGRPGEAVVELEPLLRSRGRVFLSTLEELAPLYLALGRRAHGKATYETLHEMNPENRVAPRALARLYLEDGLPVRAQQMALWAEQLGEDDEELREILRACRE